MSDMKNIKVDPTEEDWIAGEHNITWSDGNEYGTWTKMLREQRNGLSVILKIAAPPGKAWKVVGKAPELGEEVYILHGAYYGSSGNIVAGPGTYMFNSPGALHGGIQRNMSLFIHWCSGKPDDIISRELIDFEPKEEP